MLSNDLALMRLLVYAHAEATERGYDKTAEHIRSAARDLWGQLRCRDFDMKSLAFLADIGIDPEQGSLRGRLR